MWANSTCGKHTCVMCMVSCYGCRHQCVEVSYISTDRPASKSLKKSLTLPGENGVPVVILAAAVLLLVVVGKVRYCQHHKHSGSTCTSLLSVPFCAGGSALAQMLHVTVSRGLKANTQEVVGALCHITTINFDQIPWWGRYATLQPVPLSDRKTWWVDEYENAIL